MPEENKYEEVADEKASTIAGGMREEAEKFSKQIQELSGQIPDLSKMKMQSGPPVPIAPPPPEAPKWLVFEESIYNTANIMKIQKGCKCLVCDNWSHDLRDGPGCKLEQCNKIRLVLRDGTAYNEQVKNKEQLWKKLQHVFTFGANADEQQSSDIVQENRDGSDPAVGDNPGE